MSGPTCFAVKGRHVLQMAHEIPADRPVVLSCGQARARGSHYHRAAAKPVSGADKPGADMMTENSKTPRQPALRSETRQTNWRRANLAKYTAHLAVQRALVSGALQKQSCEVCGSEAVDAHHDRYDEPLNVRWLCRRHHVRLHKGGEDMFPVRLSE